MAKEQERKKKHFIAVLGVSFYWPCTYYFEGQEYSTKFVQEAVLRLACGELQPVDRISIFLTKEARSGNWEDRSYTKEEIEQKKGTADGTYQGLHPKLEFCLKEKNVRGITIEDPHIPTGKNKREIAEMFSAIYKSIEKDEEIYFDITHGLRNIPMLVMTILEYAKVTKNISVGGIYYGAFEVGDKEKKTAPIYDLTFYHSILSWSNAANSFIRYGHANEINDLVQEEWERLSRRIASENQNAGKKSSANLNEAKKRLSGNLNLVAKHLQELAASIETGRGDAKLENGILKRYEKYTLLQNIASEELVEEYYPFRELLNKIDDKMKGFQEVKNNLAADEKAAGKDDKTMNIAENVNANLQVGMATIDWCIENRMVQQGYTALEETIKTFLCVKIGVPQDREVWREAIVKRLCSGLYEDVMKGDEALGAKWNNWKEKIQENCRDEELWQDGYNGIEKGEVLFRLICEKENCKKLIQLMDKVGKKRNDISHFGFTNDKATAESLKSELEKMAVEFKCIQGEWD